MPTRKYAPGCGYDATRNAVVVAGGTMSGTSLRTVEILDVASNTWRTGKLTVTSCTLDFWP